jgi:2Fe-2S ferredoxin
MPVIHFRSTDGREHEVQADAGTTLMRAAVDNGIEGISADCGGECACATCHVYVGGDFLELMPPVSAIEEDMLGFVVAERRPGSRLGCQIPITDALNGLLVTLPDAQH